MRDSRRQFMATGRVAVLALVLGLGGPGLLAAGQGTTATISGTVIDDTAAVVRHASIRAVNVATGVERTTATGPMGTFTVALLPPGLYRVTAQHDGFTPAEIGGLSLNVGDTVQLKMLLKVARVGAAITVSAQLARISTLPAVGTVVDRQFVANLPLNGR